jgi:hypothetical protein
MQSYQVLNGESPAVLKRSRSIATFLIVTCTLAAAADVRHTVPGLEAGFHAMYDLQFDAAHRVFADWQTTHPQDPLGPASDAAAYLFSEFTRLNVLQSEFLTDDSNFLNHNRIHPDAAVKQSFEAQLDRAKALADAALARNPNDTNALFANIMVYGLRGDYVALIEKRDAAGLTYMKQARAIAQKLLAADPSCYDAYLAVGVENYLLSLKPAPLRWFLRLGGAEVDRNKGIENLRLTAEKGHYLQPYARLLLAVAALREHDRDRARELLTGLARQFPGNPLYARELALMK